MGARRGWVAAPAGNGDRFVLQEKMSGVSDLEAKYTQQFGILVMSRDLKRNGSQDLLGSWVVTFTLSKMLQWQI
jgi:hypothetical protein